MAFMRTETPDLSAKEQSSERPPVSATVHEESEGLVLSSNQNSAEARALKTDAHWRRLIAKVYSRPAGFEALSEDEKHYFAVSELDGQVGNGGFAQYFYNASADHYDYAAAGLLRLGAHNSLEYLQAAKRVIFGQKKVPKEKGQRRRRLDTLHQDWFLDVLDTAHYADSDALRVKLERFAIETGLNIGG